MFICQINCMIIVRVRTVLLSKGITDIKYDNIESRFYMNDKERGS